METAAQITELLNRYRMMYAVRQAIGFPHPYSFLELSGYNFGVVGVLRNEMYDGGIGEVPRWMR